MTVRWQQILSQGFSDPQALLTYLGLPVDMADERASRQFPVRVPKGFVDRMVPGDSNDPLLRQVLAVEQENDSPMGYTNDPLMEAQANPVPGIIHKYYGRVLMTLAGACAINCRYCFRRHFPYQDNVPGKDKLTAMMQYVASDVSIKEVILSGGDPLLVGDKQISLMLDQLEAISHVDTIRIHSRIPIVLPERITPTLLDRLHQSRCHVVLVVHCNHPNELCTQLKPMFQSLRDTGVHLLNQTVLLRQVNDDAQTLIKLSRSLFDYGVLPYYLHTLDKVLGAAHFDINLAKAKQMYQQLQESLPGYLVPKLVTENPGVRHKVMVSLKQPH